MGRASGGLSSTILMNNAAGAAVINEAATSTNPTLTPNRAELDTGIGWASDKLHLVLGGADEYEFNATAADFNSNNVTNMGSLNGYTVADMATHSVTLFPEAGTGTGVTEASSVGRGPCVSFGDNSAEQAAFYLWYCPASFNTMTKAVVRYLTTATGADVRLEALSNVDAIGETMNNQQDSISASMVTITQNVWAEHDIRNAFTEVAAGDQVQIRFQRVGNHGDDTITTLEVCALDIEWT